MYLEPSILTETNGNYSITSFLSKFTSGQDEMSPLLLKACDEKFCFTHTHPIRNFYKVNVQIDWKFQ